MKGTPVVRLFSAALITLAACSGDGPAEPTRVASSIQLTPSTLTLSDGETGQLVARVLDQDGQPLPGAEVRWSSSDVSVATVDAEGIVAALRPGTAEITATLNDLSAQATVVVEPIATQLVPISGDDQEGTAGTPLADSLVVRVLDRHGNGVAGIAVEFEVTQGGGTISPSTVQTDAAGFARALWTIGEEGEQRARATAIGEAVTFTATATAPAPRPASVEITPATAEIRVGETLQLEAAALDDAGQPIENVSFTWSSSDSTVASVDQQGLVTGRSVGQTIIRAAAEGVTGSAEISVAPEPSEQCSPGTARSLAVGETLVLAGAEAETLCVGGNAADAEYVAVPFLASDAFGTTVELELSGAGVTGVTGPPNPALPTSRLPRLEASEQQGDWEMRLREREIRELTPLIPAARADGAIARSRLAADVPSVGELLTLNAAASCTNPDRQTGRVEYISERAIIVADTANPEDGFTESDFRDVAESFDALVYPVNVRNFGEPTDIDENGRVIIFYTRAVNERTPPDAGSVVSGFFWSGDLFPTTQCAGSNFAEIFYMLAPDPTGEINGNVRTTESVKQQTVGVVGHEFQHLINASRRIYVNDARSLEEVWLNEALSHIAEELLFYEVTPMEPRMNIDVETLRSSQQILDAVNQFQIQNLRRYRSYLVNPDTTSLLGIDALPTRGASWAFLRYAADREVGPDQQFFFGLVNSTATGIQNLAQFLPEPPLLWMQEWTVAVYADDAVPGTSAAFEQPSWNFRSVIPAIDPNSRFPLRVTVLSDAEEVNLTIKAGGAAFVRFGVESGAAAVLSATVGGTAPPESVRLSVMRTR